jgi:hypothetical protein
MVARHSQLESLTKLKLISKGIFLFLKLIICENKATSTLLYKVFLIAKSGPGFMVSLDLSRSLNNMVVVIAQTIN